MVSNSLSVIAVCVTMLLQVALSAPATQDAAKVSPAAPSPMIMPPGPGVAITSPESSTTNQQLNLLGGITGMVADAVKNTIAQQGTSILNSLGGGTGMAPAPQMPASFMPPAASFNPMGAMGGMGMFNPMSMFGMMGSSGSPFGMMRPMMMWNMFDNMFEMMSF